MKKLIALSILGLLIMAFSATVYAQGPKLDFRASGSINMITMYYQNVPVLNGGAGITGMSANYNLPDQNAWNRKNSWIDSRGHLKFDAIIGKELSGTIMFELDSTRWGDTAGDRGAVGYWTTDRSGVEVKHVFFDVAIPVIPIPINMRFGQQPLSVRPFIFIGNDGSGITTTIKIDPATINVYWFKALEGTQTAATDISRDWEADDVDIYGAQVNAKIGPITPGVFGFYYNMNSYRDASPAPSTTQLDRASMLWLGAYADGKLGPVNINFDFIWDHGKIESRVNPAFPDVKYRGWMTKAKVDFPWEMFNFGVQGLYGSGADRYRTDANGLANGTNTKVQSFVVPIGSEAGPASSNDSSVLLSVHAGSAGGIGFADNLNWSQMNRGPVGGIWWLKAYAGVKPTPWYKATLQALYIGDTTKHGNTLGTAVDSSGALRDDKTIGWELDLVNEISVYKNLKFDVAGGILLRKKALEMYDSVTGTNEKMRCPWAITTRLTYSF